MSVPQKPEGGTVHVKKDCINTVADDFVSGIVPVGKGFPLRGDGAVVNAAVCLPERLLKTFFSAGKPAAPPDIFSAGTDQMPDCFANAGGTVDFQRNNIVPGVSAANDDKGGIAFRENRLHFCSRRRGENDPVHHACPFTDQFTHGFGGIGTDGGQGVHTHTAETVDQILRAAAGHIRILRRTQ